MIERLSVDMEQQDGGVVLRLAGTLDRVTAPAVAGVLEALLGRRDALEVDLEHVAAIDGAGIDLLLDAQQAAERNGHELAVTGLQQSLRRRRSPEPAGSKEAAAQ